MPTLYLHLTLTGFPYRLIIRFTCFLQYMLCSPIWINVLQIYAFSNLRASFGDPFGQNIAA